MEDRPSPDRQSPSEGIARSAAITSIAVGMSRVTGLVRETIMGSLFGATMQADAFRIGFLLPNLTRDLFAEGALSNAFVPTFVDHLTTKSKEEAFRLANLLATALILIVGCMCLCGVVFAPFIVDQIFDGFHNTPGKFELTVAMTRIMFPFLLLVALAAQVMGVLNACHEFAVPAMASTFFNIGSVGFGLVIGFLAGPHIGVSKIEGMAWGVVCGGALQLAWQIPALYKQGFRFRPEFDWSHPGMRHIFTMMGPAILGNAAVQINVMVNNKFASHIVDPQTGGDGPVTWLNAAFRFMQLPLGLFGVAIAAATLPALSRSSAIGNMDELRKTLSRSIGLVLLLTIPSSVGLFFLGDSMIGAIYQWGKFTAYDTHQTALALSAYALGLAGYSALKVLAPAFYALKDSRTPMVVSLCSIGINFAVAWFMTQRAGIGHAGLALSTAAVATFNCLVLFVLLRARLGGIYGRDLAATVLKVVCASAVMGVAIGGASYGIHALLGQTQLARFVDLGVSIPLGLAAFYAACRFAEVSELEMAMRAVMGPLSRLRGKMTAGK